MAAVLALIECFREKKTDVTEKNGAARDGGGEVKGGAGGQEGGVFRSL